MKKNKTMEEARFFDYEAIEEAIVSASRYLNSEKAPMWVVERIDSNKADKLNDILIELISNSDLFDEVIMTKTKSPPAKRHL